MKIRPRPGIILPGIPAKGAEVDDKLAKEWVANGLAVSLEDAKPPEKRKRGRPRKVKE